MRRLLAVAMIIGSALLVLLALPLAIFGVVGAWLGGCSEILVRGAAERLRPRTPEANGHDSDLTGADYTTTCEQHGDVVVTYTHTAPTPIPSREALLRQVDTLRAIGASPNVLRIAHEAVETHHPRKVH